MTNILLHNHSITSKFRNNYIINIHTYESKIYKSQITPKNRYDSYLKTNKNSYVKKTLIYVTKEHLQSTS